MAFRSREMMKKLVKKIGGEQNLAPGVKDQLKKWVPDRKIVMGRANRGLFAGRHIQFGNRVSEDGCNNHAGLLEDGLRYFHSMESGYGVKPGVEHYGCMVDMLGRTGHVDQALELISGMRMRPGSAIWGSLLSSCRGHRDHLETAVVAAERLLELEPGDTGNLVLLANIYADLGKWGEVSRLRKAMRGRRPGCSLIEVDSVVE